MNDKKIRLQEREIEYKKGIKWYTVPYVDIIRAYLRIEGVNGRVCCGVASFDMYFLMLKTREELIKIEASSQETVKEMLSVLKEKNPEIEIGYKKPE